MLRGGQFRGAAIDGCEPAFRPAGPAGKQVRRLKACPTLAALLLAFCPSALAQLNQNCIVSVLNRSVPVNPDGSWVLPNIPANFGQVKARATCVQNGQTIFGESAFFSVPANSAVNLPAITLGTTTPIPVSLSVGPSGTTLTTACLLYTSPSPRDS